MIPKDSQKPEALLFDLDGTLFRTETLSLPAYHSVFDELRKEGLWSGDTPPEERFLQSLGLLLEEIWKRVMPSSPVDARRRANELLLKFQTELLADGMGDLYSGVEDTLRELHRRGYRLFVASNGLEAYVKGVMEAKGLAPLFTALYSAGEFQTKSKVDLVGLLLQRFAVKSAWMCGDRSSDVEAGIKNGLKVVGCDYAGFQQSGELDDADLVIRRFDELLNYLE